MPTLLVNVFIPAPAATTEPNEPVEFTEPLTLPLTVILPLLPLMTPLGNVAVTPVNSLPSPCSKPNEPVEVAEPLILVVVISNISTPPAETLMLSADDSLKCVFPPPSKYNFCVAGTPAPAGR